MIHLIELWCLFIFSRIHTYCVKKAACGTNLDDKWKELKWEVEKDYAEARRWWKKRLQVLSVPWAGAYFSHGERPFNVTKEGSPGTWEIHINMKLNPYKSIACSEPRRQECSERSENQCLPTSGGMLISTTLVWSKYLDVLLIRWNNEGTLHRQGWWSSELRFSVLPEFASSGDRWPSANILQPSHMQFLCLHPLNLYGSWVC